MTDIRQRVESLLGRIKLVEEINNIIAKKENIYDSLPINKVFKSFIENLNALAPASPPNNWEEDKQFLKLIEVVNQQIINQLTEGEQIMTGAESAGIVATKTSIVMGLGVIGLIGIGLYAYRCQKNKEGVSNNKNTGSNIMKEIMDGLKPPQQPRQPPPPPPPTYKQHILLLVTDAKQLDKTLQQNRHISKAVAEKIIANATFAYCFAEGDSEGQNVLNAVECSDEAIIYDSEEKVFLQLSLSAKPEITAGKRDKLGIREAMAPEIGVELNRLQKLQKMRSVKVFHSI